MGNSWQSLLPIEWVDCVTLHNLPINVSIDNLFSTPCKKQKCIVSFYELSKSATNWGYPDFVLSRRKPPESA